MVWSIQGVGGKPMCDPEDHKYYHTQADSCLQCEKCLQGEEAISLELPASLVLPPAQNEVNNAVAGEPV
uniref:Uncharacterized protein n=1 Tax=Magallana gigas TaxID=29159 RepID=K1Q9G4_MAGGI